MTDPSIRGRYAGVVEHTDSIVRSVVVGTDADGAPRVIELQQAAVAKQESLQDEVDRMRRTLA
jgi:hypothetical protein